MKMNKAVEGIIVFSFIFAVMLISVFAVFSPIVQDAYRKGYARGLSEKCGLIYQENQAEGWFVNFSFNSTWNLNFST